MNPDGKIKALQTQLDSCIGEVGDLTQELRYSNERVVALEGKVEALAGALNDLDLKVEELEGRIG